MVPSLFDDVIMTTRTRIAFMLIVAFLLLSGLSSCSTVRSSSASVIYSSNVKDSFELYIDVPDDYNRSTNYSVVLYVDANLKSGKELRRQISLDSNQSKLHDVIFVGIGHIGNYRSKRRRDLIPPVMKNATTYRSDDPYYGQAESFYQFLTTELMPYVNNHYPNNGQYSFIGHSFGGLFGFYCFSKPSPVFKNIVAMSPSLWVNNSNFFNAEEQLWRSGIRERNVTLYHSCGSAEWINRVLSSSRKMRDILQKRYYRGLKYIYSEHEGKDHNGVVPVSLQYVISNIDF